MEIPETHYARSADGLELAYQQWGDGPRLLLVPALVSNVELDWEHEFNRRAREHLGRHLCVVEFDKRGMGLSDRFDRAPSLDERLQDIVSVMDAVGWERANIFGASEGGLMSQLFAAEFPERVDNLVLCNTFLGPQHLPRLLDHVLEDDPPLKSLDQTVSIFTHIGEGWSDDPERMVDFMMPSQLGNESFTRWVGRFQRFAVQSEGLRHPTRVSPGTSIPVTPRSGSPPRRSSCTSPVTGSLPVAARSLAEIIAGAEYVELEGEDHYAWIMPTWRELTDQIIEFCGGTITEHGGDPPVRDGAVHRHRRLDPSVVGGRRRSLARRPRLPRSGSRDRWWTSTAVAWLRAPVTGCSPCSRCRHRASSARRRCSPNSTGSVWPFAPACTPASSRCARTATSPGSP